MFLSCRQLSIRSALKLTQLLLYWKIYKRRTQLYCPKLKHGIVFFFVTFSLELAPRILFVSNISSTLLLVARFFKFCGKVWEASEKFCHLNFLRWITKMIIPWYMQETPSKELKALLRTICTGKLRCRQVSLLFDMKFTSCCLRV